MNIALYVQEGFFASAVTSTAEILHVAEMIRPTIDPSIPPISVTNVGDRVNVRSNSGFTARNEASLADLDRFDLVIVPGFGTLTGEATIAALESEPARNITKAVRGIDVEQTRLAAACTGVFVLGQAGQIENRRATTTWYQVPQFKTLFPNVRVELNAMVVEDGPILTAGAAFGHIDLSLAVIRSLSPNLADEVAGLLLIDERVTQSVFVVYDHLQHNDRILLAFEKYVREQLHEPFDINSAVRAIGTSRRTLERRAAELLGMSPLGIVRRIRAERARHLRAVTKLSTEEIADQVGYMNAESLRSLERQMRSNNSF